MNKQEKSYSCGAFALKNCLSIFNIERSESTIRKHCSTTKEGTNEIGLIKTIEYYNLGYKIIYSINPRSFKRRLIYPAIVLSDNLDHWICVLNTKYKKYHIIDSLYNIPDRLIRSKDFIKLAENLDRETSKIYYYAIGIWKPTKT